MTYCSTCGRPIGLCTGHATKFDPKFAGELRNMPNAQEAWDTSYRIAEKFPAEKLADLEAILDEQERIPPDSIANTYYAWVTTLGLARAAVRIAKEAKGWGRVAEQKAGPRLAVLHCPDCGTQHIDVGKWAKFEHKRHLCYRCGKFFEDAAGPSIGVAQ